MKTRSFTVTLQIPDNVELTPEVEKELGEHVAANIRLWHESRLWNIPVEGFTVRAHKEYTDEELREIGDKIAEIYLLRPAGMGRDGYRLSTGWKTNLGLARQFMSEGADLIEGYGLDAQKSLRR